MKMTRAFLSGDGAHAPVMKARTLKVSQVAAPLRPVITGATV